MSCIRKVKAFKIVQKIELDTITNKALQELENNIKNCNFFCLASDHNRIINF